jgi:hypothetical protein
MLLDISFKLVRTEAFHTFKIKASSPNKSWRLSDSNVETTKVKRIFQNPKGKWKGSQNSC